MTKLSEFPMILVMLAGLAAFADAPAGEGGGEGSSGEEAPGARKVQEVGTYGNTPAEFVPYGKSDEPYRRFFMTPLVFRGPGRDKPEPEGLGAVRVGLIAPLEGIGADQPGPDMQRGVVLALEEANAAGGHRGLPFELVTKNDAALWGSSSNTLVELAHEDRVWALIGSIDSNTTPVALLLWLDPEPAERFLKQIDPDRCPAVILGSTRIDDPRVLADLPHWIETLALPLLRPDQQEMLYEALGYDMVTAIAPAARRAGATPAKIREGLSEASSLPGRSGTFHFDQRGNRTGDLSVGVIRGENSRVDASPRKVTSHGRPTT